MLIDNSNDNGNEKSWQEYNAMHWMGPGIHQSIFVGQSTVDQTIKELVFISQYNEIC